MAGKTIYTGAMIADLESKIDSMITTLNAHTTALGNITDVVGQGVTTLNVASGSTHEVELVSADYTQGVASGSISVTTVLKSFKSFGVGSVRFKGSFLDDVNNANNATYGTFVLSGSDASSVTLHTMLNINGAYVTTPVDIVIPVSAGVTYQLKAVRASNSAADGTLFKLLAGAHIEYNLLDIVNDGAFAAY